MSRFEARLARLEAANPEPIAAPAERAPVDFSAIVSRIKSESARFAMLSPRQKVIELRDRLRQERAPKASPITGLREKIDLVFDDVIEGRLREAEAELLAVLGHPNARHPLAPELREIIDFELFDA